MKKYSTKSGMYRRSQGNPKFETAKVVTKTKYVAKRRKYTRNPGGYGLKSLLGNSKFLHLNYTAGGFLTLSTTEFSNSISFRLNSIYDPDIGTVAPPTKNKGVEGLSQLAALYSRYQCYGCKMIVTFQNLSASALRCVVSATNDNTIYATSRLISDIASRQGARNKLVGPLGSSNDKCTIVLPVNLKQIAGLTKATYSQDNFSANFASNPVIGLYGYVSVGTQYDAQPASNSNYSVAVKLIYGCRVYDIIENMDQ